MKRLLATVRPAQKYCENGVSPRDSIIYIYILVSEEAENVMKILSPSSLVQRFYLFLLFVRLLGQRLKKRSTSSFSSRMRITCHSVSTRAQFFRHLIQFNFLTGRGIEVAYTQGSPRTVIRESLLVGRILPYPLQALWAYFFCFNHLARFPFFPTPF